MITKKQHSTGCKAGCFQWKHLGEVEGILTTQQKWDLGEQKHRLVGSMVDWSRWAQDTADKVKPTIGEWLECAESVGESGKTGRLAKRSSLRPKWLDLLMKGGDQSQWCQLWSMLLPYIIGERVREKMIK